MDKKIKLLAKLRKRQKGLKEVIANLEQEIVAGVPDRNIEGATKTPWGSVTTRLIRELNYKAYQALNLPEKEQFVTFTPKIDLKKLRAVDLVHPGMSAICVTVKPAKTVIKIKEAANES